MKKLFLMAVAAVAMLATSCSKDDTNAVAVGEKSTVTFAVEAPVMATRAADSTYGDGYTATQLSWGVYDAEGKYLRNLSSEVAGVVEFPAGSLTTTVEIDLVNGKSYEVIFWAGAEGAPYDVDFETKKMTVNDVLNANQEAYDAFYKHQTVATVDGPRSETIVLTRPFAQLNIATADTQKAKDGGLVVAETKVVVNAYKTLDLVEGTVADKTTRTYKFSTIPSDANYVNTITVGGKTYDLLSMNYLLVNTKQLENVEFTVKNGDFEKPYTYSNVPLQRNYKTNIIGNLLTSTLDFDITIDPIFEKEVDTYVTDADALINAVAGVADGDTITVAAGTYPVVLDITGAKNFTLKAAKDAVVTIAGVDHQTNGTPSTVTFEGITFDNSIVVTRAEGGWFTGTAQNIAPCVGAWGGDLTFNNCKFIVAGTSGRETGVMTWWTGNNQMSLAFNGCEFVGKDNHASARAMQIYGKVDMEVNNCTFTTAKDYTLKYVAGEGNVAVFEGNTVSNSENFVELGSSAYPGNKYTVKINNNTLNSVNPYVVANKENQTIYVNNQVVEIVADAVANVASQSDLANALTNADKTKTTVINVAAGEYTMPSGLNKNVTLNCAEGTVFKGNSKLNINGATVVGATFSNPSGSAVDQTINGTFKGCEFGGSNAVRYAYAGETVVFEDCVFSGNVYGIHFDGGKNDVIFRNCTISGFNALGADLTMVTFEGCTFVGNGKSGYNGANLWGSAKMINCEFTFDDSTANEWIDCIGADKTYEFVNCTVNGVAYTADNYAEYGDIFSRNHVAVKINGADCQM